MTNRTHIAPVLALLLALLSTGGALAQGFGSISSMGDKPAPAVPAPGPAPQAAMPPAASTGGASAQGFGSISSMGGSQPVVAPANVAAGAAPSIPVARTAGSSAFQTADRIVVKKGERKLYLLRSKQIIAEYPVRLGLNPYGHKEREGDFRTPEGTYQLVRRNPRSEFFLSLEVSYPNDADRARARRQGVKPGGAIMIHGQPNVLRKPAEYYARNDWTNGCIAVSNADMVEIWLRTGVGTTIEIRP